MFTGIIETLATVDEVDERVDAARLTISGSGFDDIVHGDSIAVNGVCLTAVDVDGDTFTAHVMNETLVRSTLGALRPGDRVNLERAVTPTTRLGGHIVQGHVDGVGTVLARRPAEHWADVDIEVPAELCKYIVEKGSITVDGISLTVADVDGATVRVSLIPETLERTTLGRRQVGERVNLEVDVIAKHIERLLADRVISGRPA
jgi:riboflavin synthase